MEIIWEQISMIKENVPVREYENKIMKGWLKYRSEWPMRDSRELSNVTEDLHYVDRPSIAMRTTIN